LTTVRIDERFHGPPDSGNGGYVCGLVAGALGGSGCTVTLHKPPPLGRELELTATPSGAELRDGTDLVASAIVEEAALSDEPAPPTLAAARAAEPHFVGHQHHRFPSCFVCGPERGPGEGLSIFAGPVDQARVAASWTPGADLADEDGRVRREFLWAAMDCPGYFAVEQAAGLALLGRMNAVILEDARAAEALVVTGWAIASEGRKHQVGTALHRPGGELVATARATWITLRG
jgi:hypothetical protein